VLLVHLHRSDQDLEGGGHFFLNAPSNGPYHGYPFDNWRFYSGRRACSCRLVESGTLRQETGWWNDFIAVFQKGPAYSAPREKLLDAFPNATNVRYGDRLEFTNPAVFTEDVELWQKAAAAASDVEDRASVLNASLEATAIADREALSVELAGIRSTIEALESDLLTAKSRISEMHASTSWRIMAPMRAVRHFFSRRHLTTGRGS
jgi:hypothetical protein